MKWDCRSSRLPLNTNLQFWTFRYNWLMYMQFFSVRINTVCLKSFNYTKTMTGLSIQQIHFNIIHNEKKRSLMLQTFFLSHLNFWVEIWKTGMFKMYTIHWRWVDVMKWLCFSVCLNSFRLAWTQHLLSSRDWHIVFVFVTREKLSCNEGRLKHFRKCSETVG